MTGGCADPANRPHGWLALKTRTTAPSAWLRSRMVLIVLAMTSLIAACASLDAPGAGCEWIRPIILDEDDRLTTETKRALLAHNEAWSEFCK